jgi:hypothetical protein
MKWAQPILTASMLVFIALVRTAVAHPFIVDQSFEPPPVGEFIPLQAPSSFPIGQEFTPNLHSLDVVQLFLEGLPNSPGANVFVHVRQSTVTGSILGTSQIINLPHIPPGGFISTPVHFDFDSSVALVPGNLYVIDLQFVPEGTGGNWAVLSGGLNPPNNPPNPYAGGRLIVGGTPISFAPVDLWFQEGPAGNVPEPSAMSLFVAAALFGLVGVRVLRTIL